MRAVTVFLFSGRPEISPQIGSSLFLIKSLYKLYRKWDSLHSLQTVFNRRNLVCNFSWTFLMFSGCFEQRYAYFNVISRLFEDVYRGLQVRTTADGKVQHALLLYSRDFHTSKYNLAVERMKTNQIVFVL